MSELDDIYQLRKETEEGIRQVFEALDITAITRANAPENFKQATPRVEIKISVGAATGHRFICPDGIARYDRWRATVAVQAVTRPTPDGVNNIQEAYVARIRKIMSLMAQQTWLDFDHFPNTRFAEPFRDSNSDGTLKVADGIEYTVLSYAGTLCVREIAWPVPVNPVPPPSGGPILDDSGNPILDDGGNAVLSD